MSNKEPSPSSGSPKDDQVPDLSALDFGPAWAKKDAGSKPKPRSNKGPGHGAKDKGGKRRQDTRGGDRSQGHRADRRPGRRPDRDRREGKPATPPAEGVTARIMPVEEALDLMAKEIKTTGRTHSVFDVAWTVLGGLERFNVIFESEEQPLYQCRKDHSVWQTKAECLRHFWSSGMAKDHYDEEVTEGEAPAGNFQSVARCGLSGKLIGPPNHHSYQQMLTDIHRGRYSSMAIEKYKSKIVMEHGEEAVGKWIEQVKKQSVWRPKPAGAPATAANDDADDGEPATPPPAAGTVPVFKTRREVEQHFLTNGFGDAFHAGKTVSIRANVPPKMISPPLMATLRHVVAEEKRYPGNLASFLCRQMSGRHLAVFKWKKRLHCGPARPKHVPDDMVMADRPSKLFHWVLDHPSGSIDKMWQDCLPKDVDDATRHTWYHDLHWLINEGLVLLFSDGSLHAAKELKQDAPQKPKAKDGTRPAGGEEGENPAAEKEPPAEPPAGPAETKDP